jgi:hypothetical protein
MRRLLPLILSVALAIRTADYPTATARKRARRGHDAPAWMHPQVARPLHGQHPAAAEPWQALALQTAAFDAATGTLTWFDDELSYN